TFQLPALMAGENEKGLTVVISPLQSLMKDQTDNLENQHNITAAVTINGSLDPLDRAKAIERVENGSASILYISPESLRSKSIERLLVGRNVVRFVIDEAHCFSAWGQDFRVDYLYIGEFVANLQKTKNMSIPCSCFTATAKPRVIADIQKYFRDALSIELEIFKASAARVNLSYHIFAEAGQNGKGLKLRQLLTDNDCPTIIYVSRTRRTEQLAAKLTEDGFPALAYHGQMDKQQRIANQDAFMNGEVKIIVATTAFGMGVDKKDIEMVIHYDISASLEDYVQEAGRAGRDENIKADCYVLYEDEDLNKHFNLLNQTKLSQKEIGQIWRALRQLTKKRSQVSQSALEIARTAGWDDSIKDMETRVKTAISALEQSGFVKRGQNMPRIFADSILVKTMAQARERIDNSARFDDASRQTAVRILSNLFSAKSRQKGSHDEGESRIEYISDRLGVEKEDVIRVIGLLREEKILSDAKDLAAHLDKTERGAKNILTAHINIENFLCGFLSDEEKNYNIKEIYEALQAEHLDTTIKQLGTVINYFAIKRLIKRTAHEFSKNHVTISPYVPMIEIAVKNARRHEIASFIINYLYAGGEETVLFSVLELKDEFNRNLLFQNAKTEEIEDALYYLLKIGAMKIDGGFLVIYNAMRLERLELGNKQYNKEHYAKLEDYYQNKRQQIHIVGEYANRLIEDYSAAMDFVNDYFTMDYNLFLRKYFRGRRDEISKNITPKKFKQIFGELSPAQLGIINDHESKYIVVAAGPGSGKTKLLTHKLASLYMMEDVKHEQMLMLTFSRAAATEFKKRLMGLIGNAANFIQITTFHSYCFDLLGKVGDLEKSQNIVGDAIEKINAGEVDTSRLTKTVLVIDEAQDMSAAEFSLVKTLAGMNEEMRIIAVGDDDQNIYEFRGSDSAHFASLLREPNAAKYELVENYRSRANIVEFANQFAETISRRLKTLPIMSKTAQSGEIHLTRLTSHHVEIPVVNAFLTQVPQGTTCIAARTNEEVLNIIGLLAREGIPARRITDRDDDGFNWRNIVELRDFAASFADESYTITDDIWASSKAMLLRKYAASADLPCILHLIADFEATNNKTKYKSDFWQFVRESKLDDFIADSETVLVSTIHKTKGREFDNVFLALGATDISGDASKRAIYVAITRAKKNLYVLFGGNYFNKINVLNKHGNKHGTKLFLDKTMYPRSERILFELGLGDVNLGDMKRLAKEIDLVSGQTLTLTNGGCCFNDKNCFFKFSKKFLSVIAEREANGYFPASAYINHIVLWHEKESDVEFKIILPCIEFARR
ncbi:MAG: RecQ family ATP-dependent DNA helicase, partial [Defluviitaleaceae bacterium]|nr:RecQ family ATP-dependent DNA helicase [Defluviitaleaceae bacterium]